MASPTKEIQKAAYSIAGSGKNNTGTDKSKTSARLFFFDAGGGRVFSANPDGSELKTIVSGGRKFPERLVVDTAAGHIYWTNMSNPVVNDGSIERTDFDGSNTTNIIRPGGTFTLKQLQLDEKNRKLYWCIREGMRVMRANLNGSNIETLVDTSGGDARPGKDQKKWCVSIAVDDVGGRCQKGPDKAGEGRIFRANLEIPKGQTAANRKDIELLYDGLPEPIALELGLANRTLYWTDRGDPPRGNTLNRAPMDSKPRNRKQPEILYNDLMEGIGLALDLKGGSMFITGLADSVYSANLDGSNKKTLLVGKSHAQQATVLAAEAHA
jgi:hypothetical protein